MGNFDAQSVNAWLSFGVWMPGYADPKWYDQLVENFRVYLEAKIYFDSSRTFFPKIWAKWIFMEKRLLSVFKYSNYLRSCKKWEENNHQFLRKMTNRRTDRQTGNQTDRQTGRQVERQTPKRTGRQQWFYRTMRKTGV